MEEAIRKIVEMLSDYDVELLVIGRPGSLSGGGGQMAEEVEQFASKLAERGYKTHLIDERLSSREAERTMRMAGKSSKQMRGKLDSIAAQLILQKYMDALSS
jgi:putative Holliday junction resolvase